MVHDNKPYHAEEFMDDFKSVDLGDYRFTVSSDGFYIFDDLYNKRRWQCSCKVGYMRVWSSGAKRIRRSFMVHRLVAMAFFGCPEGYESMDVNHKDGNKGNNHVSNLEWVTKSENQRHALMNGLFKSKLPSTPERKRLQNRLNQRKFRNKFNPETSDLFS